MISNTFGSENQQMEVDAKNTQLIDEHEHVNQIDLNIEDFGSDFNNEVFQDG